MSTTKHTTGRTEWPTCMICRKRKATEEWRITISGEARHVCVCGACTDRLFDPSASTVDYISGKLTWFERGQPVAGGAR